MLMQNQWLCLHAWKPVCEMAWFSWMRIICCTDLVLDTLLAEQLIATSGLFRFQGAENRTLEDVLKRRLLCWPLLWVFEAGSKANGGKKKVKYSKLPASALCVWCDPGHSNVTVVPLGSPLRI